MSSINSNTNNSIVRQATGGLAAKKRAELKASSDAFAKSSPARVTDNWSDSNQGGIKKINEQKILAKSEWIANKLGASRGFAQMNTNSSHSEGGAPGIDGFVLSREEREARVASLNQTA